MNAAHDGSERWRAPDGPPGDEALLAAVANRLAAAPEAGAAFEEVLRQAQASEHWRAKADREHERADQLEAALRSIVSHATRALANPAPHRQPAMDAVLRLARGALDARTG